MNTQDALLASTIALDLITKLANLAQAQRLRAAEGRSVTAEDLDSLGLADDAAAARQKLQLAKMREAEPGTPSVG